MELITTNISQLFWCSYDTKNEDCQIRNNKECDNTQCNGNPILNNFKPAIINNNEISWFDKLFINGIKVTDSNPTTMIISGPPGSGKSTLALELCYRIASQEPPLLPLYISFESNTNSLIEKAKKFGWNNFTDELIPYTGNKDEYKKEIHDRKDKNIGTIAFWDKDTSKRKFPLDPNALSLTYDLISNAIRSVSEDFIDIKKGYPLFLQKIFDIKQKGINEFHPNVLVIDSLNIVSNNEQRSLLFENINENMTNTQLVILIIDSIDKQHNDWEFKSDIILKLDYFSNNDYFLRTIEIVKARNQEHILGKHQMKIHSKFEEDSAKNQRYCDKNIIHHRSHPYRESGGIIIYPSIHYYLSGYRKRSSPSSTEKSTDYPFQLGEILNLPFGRCTGLVGERGTHKSHLAYMYLLYNIIAKGYRGLIITLREDEKKTIEALQIILNQLVEQTEFPGDRPSKNIYDYIHSNRLEILYFLPGYITPNEFFHRIFISTHRMKQNESKVISIFNSLDQIEARFPLCTKEDIFIPSIIEFFLGEHITNIFIAVNEDEKTLDKYGLLPMADYVLSFKKKPVDPNEFQNQFTLNSQLRQYFNNNYIGVNKIETVEVKVEKHSGGRPKVRKGILELDSSQKYFTQEGIYFS
jgi:KaiC/GvpD/RAD55 family RecA-like ATPase